MWEVWWIWIAAAIVLGILEMLAPGFILLGFAIGAGMTGVILLLGGPVAAFMLTSLPMTLLMFASFSLVAWLVLRRAMGVRKGQTRLWDRDINED